MPACHIQRTEKATIGSDGSRYEKRGKGKPACIDGEIPFDIPEGWEWARLETVTTYIQRGKSPKYSVEEKYPVVAQKCNQWSGFSLEKAKFVDPESVSSYAEERLLVDGDLLWNSTGLGTLGRMAVYDSGKNLYGWAVADSHVTVIRTNPDWLSYEYAFLYFAGPSVQLVIEDQASGSTKQKELAQETVKQYLIPIPPLAEQRRIAERVSELMPLVEEYGKLEDEREALDAALPERLRKSVLQMAVEGKLVAQDPADEPASVLLEHIREERAKLIEEKKIKVPKGSESVIYLGSDGRRYEKRVDAKGRETEPACIDDEIPFDIPEDWEWARLCNLADFGGGKTPSTNDKSNYADDGILWVTSKDMKRDFIDSTLITLSEKGASDLTLYKPGTLLMVTRSGILRRLLPVAMLKKSATVNQDQKAICPFDAETSLWLLTFMKASDAFIRQNYSKAGTTVESIVFDKVKTMLVPIPPLAEQRRIVAQLDSLLANIA